MQQGGDDWRDYLEITQDYYALAGIYDSVNTNTAATGWFKKPPKFDPFPTPDQLVKKKHKKVDIHSIYAALGGGGKRK